MRKIILIASLVLTGCSTSGQRMLTPYEISIIPNDCLNRKELTSWVEKQIQIGYDIKAKDEQINIAKYKLWEIRAVCNRG